MSDHLFRLDKDDNVFTVHEELPDEFIISVVDTFSAHHMRTHKVPCKMSRFFAYKLLRKNLRFMYCVNTVDLLYKSYVVVHVFYPPHANPP